MTEHVNDLYSLAKQWGERFSKEHGTSCKWVDLHASRKDMHEYKQHKISSRVTNVRYVPKESIYKDLPGTIITDSVTNDTSLEQESTFKRSKTTSSSFTWGMKESLSIGYSEKLQVGVPDAETTTTTLSVDLTLESTQSQTKTETKTWEIDRDVRVPAKTKVDMTWTISQKEVTATFYADVILTGQIAIWNKDKIDINHPDNKDKHWLWFINIADAFRQMKSWGIHVPPQYSIHGNSVTFKASGQCRGESGYSTTFQLKETPTEA